MGTKGRKVEKRKQAREDAYKETINHVSAHAKLMLTVSQGVIRND